MSHLLRFDVSSALRHGSMKRIEATQNTTGDQYPRDSLNYCESFSFDTFAACYAWALLSNHVSALSLVQAPARHRRLRHRS